MLHEIREWESGKFQVSLYDTGRRDYLGCTVIAYNLLYDGVEVFSGDDFRGSPLHADDSNETLAALLTFLSLKPGDTDREYFASYTPEQMEFAVAHGEELAMLAEELRMSEGIEN